MTDITQFLRHDTPIATGAMAVYPLDQIVVDNYEFESRFGDTVQLYAVDGEHVYLPRALCPVGEQDLRDPGEPVQFPKCPEPRENQVELFDQVVAFLKAGQSGVAVAYTGFGKTVLGYRAAAALGVKTIVVTTKEDIYAKWIEDAPKFLGLDPSEVGQVRADKAQFDRPFVVAMIHSLTMEGKYPPNVDKGFGLVIFDECHRLPADKFSRAASMFRAKLRLGLSATPRRPDGKEILLHAHVGPIRAKTTTQLMLPKVLRYRTAWQCPRVFRTNKKTGEKKIVRVPHEPGKTTHMEKMLAADKVRNHQIAETIVQAYQKGRRLVVFSTLLDHLSTLQRACIALGVPGKDIGHYGPAKTKGELAARDKIIVKPVIMTTYSMMGEGTDIPWLDCAVFAMPRSSVEQPAGRVRREHEGKPVPALIDFVDTDSPVFKEYALKRLRWYESIGAQVVEMD